MALVCGTVASFHWIALNVEFRDPTKQLQPIGNDQLKEECNACGTPFMEILW